MFKVTTLIKTIATHQSIRSASFVLLAKLSQEQEYITVILVRAVGCFSL